jgi:phosphonate transport system substrate-binding protein
MTVRRNRVGTAVAVLALALLSAACGVQEGTGAGSQGAGGAPAGPCTGKNDPAAADPTALTLALVPSGDANKLVQTVKPLEAALTQRLGIPVKGVITQDYQAAVEAIGADQAQIGMLPPLQMVQACSRYGAQPALQTVRAGKATYAAQFYTNNPAKYCKDTPAPDAKGNLFCNGTASGNGPVAVDSVAKVKGAKVAVLQAASSAGYIFPITALKSQGVQPSDITPLQVTAHDAAVLSVYRGDAEVGVSYWDARTVVQKDTPDVGKKVVVFALTDEIPNDGVSLSGKLNPAWQKKISDAMLDYAKTPEGVAALTAIYQITGLAPADTTALQRAQTAAAGLGLG